MPRLQELYRSTIAPGLMESFGYSSAMQIPRVVKITLNMGVGEAVGDKKILENAVNDMRLIAGQKTDCDDGAAIRSRVQDSGRMAYRLQGDAAQESNVRVPRSTHQCRDSQNAAISGDSVLERSMAVATTISGSRNRSSSRRSTTTRSTRYEAWDVAITTSAPTNDEAMALLSGFNFPFRRN